MADIAVFALAPDLRTDEETLRERTRTEGHESLAQRSRARRRPRLRQGCAAKYPFQGAQRGFHLGAARYVGTGLAWATVRAAAGAG